MLLLLDVAASLRIGSSGRNGASDIMQGLSVVAFWLQAKQRETRPRRQSTAGRPDSSVGTFGSQVFLITARDSKAKADAVQMLNRNGGTIIDKMPPPDVRTVVSFLRPKMLRCISLASENKLRH